MNPLFDDLISRDPQRVWSATSEVTTLRDPQTLDLLAARLPEIRDKTANLELGGALFPNKERLRFAIRKLEYWHAKAGCLCRLYPEYILYNPKQEAKAGNVTLLEEQANAATRETTCQCACTVCGTVFTVKEAEYHYTWWQWQIAEP